MHNGLIIATPISGADGSPVAIIRPHPISGDTYGITNASNSVLCRYSLSRAGVPNGTCDPIYKFGESFFEGMLTIDSVMGHLYILTSGPRSYQVSLWTIDPLAPQPLLSRVDIDREDVYYYDHRSLCYDPINRLVTIVHVQYNSQEDATAYYTVDPKTGRKGTRYEVPGARDQIVCTPTQMVFAGYWWGSYKIQAYDFTTTRWVMDAHAT